MAKSKGRLLAELLSADGKIKEEKSALDIAGGKLSPADIPTLPNSKLENSSITIAGESISLGGSVALNTGHITEHTNFKYHTESRVRSSISASKAGGHGALAYNSSTGALKLTGVSTEEIQDVVGAMFTNNTESGITVTYDDSDGTIDLSVAALSSNSISEGSNLYYTDARARAAISATGSLSYDASTGVMSFSMPAQNTSNITEGSNLYHTTARARAAISATGSLSYNSSTGVMSFTMPAQNTSNITEGSNLYFTNARADARIANASLLPLAGGTLTGTLNGTSASFSGSMALRADSSQLQFGTGNRAQIFHNSAALYLRSATGGVLIQGPSLSHYASDASTLYFSSASGGLSFGGTNFLTSSRVLQNVTGNISMFTNDSGYLTQSSTQTKYLRSDTQDTGTILNLNGGTSQGDNDATLHITAANNSDWGLKISAASGKTEYGATIRMPSSFNHALSIYKNGADHVRVNDTGILISGSYYVWHSGNDGSGSALDADLLDGQHGSYYLNYNNFSNTPSIPSLSGYATESYVNTQVSNLVDSAPGTLNTLNELAAALGDDANFSTTVTNGIASKLPLAGGTMTGPINMGSQNISAINNATAVSFLSTNGYWAGGVQRINGSGNLLNIGTITSAAAGTILDASHNLTNINNVYASGYRIGSTTVINSSRNITSADIHIKSGTGGTNTQGLLFTLTDNADAQAYIKKTAYYMHYNAHYNEGHRFTVNGTDDMLRMHGSNNGTRPDSIDILAGNGLYMNNTQVMTQARALTNVTGNISMFTNDSGYITSANGGNALTVNGFSTSQAGAANSIIVTQSNSYAQMPSWVGMQAGKGHYWSTGLHVYESGGNYHINTGGSKFTSAAQGTLWGSSNDGSGSGLDADLLDGMDSTRFIFGSGTSGTNQQTVTDWNSPTKSGWYSDDGASNKWSTPNWSSIMHVKLYVDNNSYASQLGFDTYNNNIYVRTNNGTWTSWDKIWHAGSDGSGSGLDADLLDGQQGSYYLNYDNLSNKPTNISNADTVDSLHASSFLRSDATDTASGAITFTNVVTIDHNTSNMLLLKPTNASPWVINIQRDDLAASRVFVNNYSSQGVGWVFEHTPYDYNSGSPGKFWSAANDGAGSGLDADLLDGQQGSYYFQQSTPNQEEAYHLDIRDSRAAMVTPDGEDNNRISAHFTNQIPGYTDWRSAITLKGWTDGYYAWQLHGPSSTGNTNSGLFYRDGKGSTWGSSYEIWHAGRDGSGSGLDADLLDGQHASAFAPIGGSTGRFVTGGLYGIGHGSSTLPIWQYNASNPGYGIAYTESSPDVLRFDVSGNLMSGTADLELRPDQLKVGGNTVYHVGNDGSGTGLDADTLDGVQGANYARLDQSNVFGAGTHSNYFRRNNVTNYTTAPVVVESYGGASTTTGVGFHISGSVGRYLFMNNSADLFWNSTSSKIWHASNDGAGSGLDADLLDGLQGDFYFKSYTNNNGGWSQANRNFSVRSGGSAAGLHMEESDGTFAFQLYGDSGSYGFLDAEWGNWDIYKTVNGAFQVDEGSGLKRVLNEANWSSYITIPTSLPANGGNADTVDSLHAASFARSDASDTLSGGYYFSGGHGAINISSSSIVSNASSSWTGNPGAQGKIQYHANRWYIVSDAASDRIVQFRRNGGDVSYIANDGSFVGNVSGTASGNLTSSDLPSSLPANGGNADTLDNIDSSQFLRSDTADTIGATLTMGTQKALVANNFGRGVYGLYSSVKHQHVWAMGTAYSLHDDGSNVGNLYGLSYTHTNIGTGYGSASAAGLGHQLNGRAAGQLQWALGEGMYTRGTITSAPQGTLWGSSNDGSGSGLDADLLDGQDGSYYYPASSAATNDRIYITDTRNADRAPSFYDDRYVQADFNQSVYFGVSGGDSWATALTVSKWASYDPSHRQEQLIFTGTKLARRVASSDSAWNSPYIIWDSSTDGSGSGLDADTVDGFDTSQTGGANKIVVSASNGYTYFSNWVNMPNGQGHYWNSGLHVNESGGKLRISGGITTEGNSHLGDAGGDYVHVNDILHVAATDSGDSHVYFGEGATGNTTYGSHYYWDSGYKMTKYSRHSGTDSAIDSFDTRYTHKIQTSRAYERVSHTTGYQIGSYNTVSGGNGTGSNPIYVIGDSYRPTNTALSNMYGIGFTDSSASFIGLTGATNWGMYVAADGDARVWLGGTDGVVTSTGQHYVGSNVVWNAGNDGSGSGLDADLLDGLELHQATNNEANKVVRTDNNGYANFGWINTVSGTASGTLSRIYCSQDGYLRYLSPSSLGTSWLRENTYNNLYDNTGSGANLNSVFQNGKSGNIDCWSGSNFPSGTSHVQGVQVRHSTTTHYGFQLVNQYNQDKIWHRRITNNTFNSWQQVWTSATDGSGSGLDADLLDGLDLHTGRNNEANKVVRTNSSGYADFGWINTTSGATTSTINRIYASDDGYIRYYTPANFGSQISQHINYNNIANKPTIPVVGTANINIVAGTGLSGGGSFSANQSNNTTITLNATGSGGGGGTSEIKTATIALTKAQIIANHGSGQGTILSGESGKIKIPLEAMFAVSGTGSTSQHGDLVTFELRSFGGRNTTVAVFPAIHMRYSLTNGVRIWNRDVPLAVGREFQENRDITVHLQNSSIPSGFSGSPFQKITIILKYMEFNVSDYAH